MATFERGFKSWAERTALTLRRELGLSALDRLDPLKLAAYLDIKVCTPRQIPGLPKDVIEQLLKEDPFGWSAVSLLVDGGGLLIYNPRKSEGRRASDITHELAHFILDHKPTTIVVSHELEIGIRSFDAKQEDEANWLAWCILLPRDAVFDSLRRRMSVTAIATQHGVTEALVSFRMRITGVQYQLRAARRRRA